MEWLRNNSIIGLSRPSTRTQPILQEDFDQSACYDSFKEHWQQTYKILARNQQLPKQDDVLGVVNHLEQMASLLLYDMKNVDQNSFPVTAMSQCLEYLIAENILSKLYEWGVRAGMYSNVIRTEQLKLYEMLISQSRHMILVHEPFLKPLIKLLSSCRGEVFAKDKDTENRLVMVLFQLCALLLQNVDLVDLFLVRENNVIRFIIFELLIQYMHRDDSGVGMRARDALLLCMSLARKNRMVATYILDHSNICVLLATGLGGLYSVLPATLTGSDSIPSQSLPPDWHRLTPDDVLDDTTGGELAQFVTSLEFSNAVVQVVGGSSGGSAGGNGDSGGIGGFLEEYVYMGFLIPVLGPALLQGGVQEQVAATAYLELIVRTVTRPGLLYQVLRLLLQKEYDSQRLLHILINRINSADSQLSLVSLALFETLVDINCEDVMLELVFIHLQPCLHLMVSQRRMFLSLDPHCASFEKFLSLSPRCCVCLDDRQQRDNVNITGLESRSVHWNHYGSSQSLYGNYHAYLCDARKKINVCSWACEQWTNSYKGGDYVHNDESSNSAQWDSMGYESLKTEHDLDRTTTTTSTTIPDWQLSYYTSTNTNTKKPTKPVSSSNNNNNSKTSRRTRDVTDTVSADDVTKYGSSGPLLAVTLAKLKNLLSTSIYVNIHLTGLISKLAVYPQPLLRSYLLDHSLVLQPNAPSLFQIIASLRQTIDEFMSHRADRDALIEQARGFFIEREIRLVRARRTAQDTHKHSSSSMDDSQTLSPRASQQQPSNITVSKRRPSLITQSLSTMFARARSNTTLSLSESGGGGGGGVGGLPMTTVTSHSNSPSQQSQVGDSGSNATTVLYPRFTEPQHVAVCAVLLDEWVKELAALAQEHTIAQLTSALFRSS